MKKVLRILFFLVGFLGSSGAYASHMAGSDMEFECINDSMYKIVLRVYRDCNGIPINATPTINFTTSGCFPQRTAGTSMTRTLVRPVAFMCDGQSNICAGGSFPFGMEENRYEVTINIKTLFPNLDSNCCWIKVSYQECCRNGSITNLNQGNFYVDAEINICAKPCNSSPKISNYPVAVVCLGQPFWFNNGFVGTDGDSLSYEMAQPLNGPNSPESFQGSFTKDRPLQFLGFPNANLPFPAGFHLNGVNGDLGFTATAIQQPVLAFQVTEWRKINGVYQKVGVTRRDVQMYTYQCPPNNPPEIWVNGSKTGPFNFTVCAGSALCLNLKVKDNDSMPPKRDTTLMSWNKAIPGATFSNTNTPVKLVREDEGTFCWTPGDEYVSSLPYYFTVKGVDDNCPVPGSATRAIGISVKARPLGTIAHTPLGCSKFKFESTVTNQNKLTQTPTFFWTIPNIGNGIFNGVNATNYNGPTIASHTFQAGGTYVARLRMEAGGCQTFIFDTVFVDSPVVGNAGIDSFICIGKSKMLLGTARNGVPPYSYKWMTGNPADTLTTLTVAPNSTQSYVLEVRDSFLCAHYDTVQVEVKPLPVIDLGPDQRVCFKDSGVFDAGINNMNGVYGYMWSMPGGKSSTDRIVTVGDSGQYVATIIDTFRCEQKDSALLFVNKEVIANAGPDSALCIYDAIKLGGKGGNTYEWISTGSDAASFPRYSDSIVINPQLDDDREYILKVTISYGGVTCKDYDTTFVEVRKLPEIRFTDTNPKFCFQDTWLDPSTKTGATPAGGFWTIADTSKAKCFQNDPAKPNYGYISLACLGLGAGNTKATYNITYNYKDVFGCFEDSTIKITILPLPTVWAGFDRVVCQNKDTVRIDPYPNFGIGSEWLTPTNTDCPGCLINTGTKHTFYPGKALASNASSSKTYQLIYKAVDADKCENQDTASIQIDPIPQVNAGFLGEVCEDVGPINLTSRSAAVPGLGGVWSGNGVGTDKNTFDPTKQPPVSTGKMQPNILQYCYTNSYNCKACDTVALVVHKLPKTKLTVDDPDHCVVDPAVTLKGTPAGPGGEYVVNGIKLLNNIFLPSDTASYVKEGANKVVFTFTDANKCKKADSTIVNVQFAPKVGFDSQNDLCEGLPYPLDVHTLYKCSQVRWYTTGDGSFSDNTAKNTIYSPGTNDVNDAIFTVTLKSVDNGICPADSQSKRITIKKRPVGDFTAVTEGCEPFRTQFKANYAPADSIWWDFGDQSYRAGSYTDQNNIKFTHSYATKGKYNVTVRVSNGSCDTLTSKPGYITVHNTPEADFSPDKKKSTVALPRFQFLNASGGSYDPAQDSVSYFWDFGDPATDQDTLTFKVYEPKDELKPDFSPTHTYKSDTGNYLITMVLTTIKGCSAEAQAYVKVDPDITVFAPNAFRPTSSDSKNKRFFIIVDGQQTFLLNIFNRWGEVVYSTHDPLQGWDGTYKGSDCQQDVYAWQVVATSFDGTTYKYSGTVTLLR